MRLGAHESIAGGLLRVFERADADRADAIQIFTANGSRWEPGPRDPGEVAEFAAEKRRRGQPVLSHASYLINLAAARGELLTRSRRAFVAELERCEALGVDHLVMHPGAHVGAGVATGLRRVAASLRDVLAKTAGFRVRVLIELTAGQGTCLGHTFDELATLLDTIDAPTRMGVCFDTCHALAAGYDFRTPDGYEAMWREFDDKIGLGELRAFHLNDSKKDVGSRVDRHEAIGKGFVGDEPFRRLVTDPRFTGVPAVLELPPSVVPANLARLVKWRAEMLAA
ncbi:MAG: deoxyribonuclease IV [Myxococcales bacterium]|nr:deoxyribonuclease IV [Myxococcales bacterium]